MSFLACITDQCKQDWLNGLHQPGDTTRSRLPCQATATDWNASYATYSSTHELATANGYTQGGITLPGTFTVGLSTDTAYLTWITTDASWTATSTGFTADCCCIYNSSRSNHVLCVLSFGTTTASGGGTFWVPLPGAGVGAAITIT